MAFIKQGQFALVTGTITSAAFKESTTKNGTPVVQFSVFAGKRHNEDGQSKNIYMPVEVLGSNPLYDMVMDQDVGFSNGEVVLAAGTYQEWVYNEKTYYKITADFLCNASNMFVVAQSLMGGSGESGESVFTDTDEPTVFDEPSDPSPESVAADNFKKEVEESGAELPF